MRTGFVRISFRRNSLPARRLLDEVPQQCFSRRTNVRYNSTLTQIQVTLVSLPCHTVVPCDYVLLYLLSSNMQMTAGWDCSRASVEKVEALSGEENRSSEIGNAKTGWGAVVDNATAYHRFQFKTHRHWSFGTRMEGLAKAGERYGPWMFRSPETSSTFGVKVSVD